MMALNQTLERKKELTAFNILKYRYCANQSRDISHDHFTKSRKLLTNKWPVFLKRNRAITFFLFILNISNISRLE